MKAIIGMEESHRKALIQEVIDRIHYSEGFIDDLYRLLDQYEAPFIDGVIRVAADQTLKEAINEQEFYN